MSTIQVTRPHNSSREVWEQITDNKALLISDASAVAIAAWWQSPGAVGHVLASFASGVAVDRRALLEDIAATITEHMRNSDHLPMDLDALQMWVLNRTSYEYDFRNDGYSKVRKAGTEGEWRL